MKRPLDATQTAPTTAALTLRALRRHPDRVAFRWDGGALTYRDAHLLIGRQQAVFDGAGLGRGDRMAFLIGNSAEAWCASVAAQGLGMAITWLHPLGSLEDHRFQLDDAGCTALVVDTVEHSERGAELTRTPSLRATYSVGGTGPGTDLGAAARDTGAATPRDLAEPGDLAILNYTSGTSGTPKGVARSHRTLSGVTTSLLADFGIPDGARYLAVAPISHVAGIKILPVLLRGGTVVLQRGFDPARVLRTIEEDSVTMAVLVPTMIYTLLDEPTLASADVSSLELVLYGASPMAPSRLQEALDRVGPVFAQLYGQTECYPISLLARGDHDPGRPELFASCGFPVASCQVRLLDEHGWDVEPGTPGEISVRSPYAMDEYWGLPELTEQTRSDGWLRTGDVATADDAGYLYIVDRKKDMVVTGGFNVFSREVEDVLVQHPAVHSAAVIGIPDQRWGEAVHAVVAGRPGAQVDVSELQAFVKSRKGSVFTPKRIDVVDTLPVNAVGKIDKQALRAPFWQGRDRHVG